SVAGISRFLSRVYELTEKVGNAKMTEKDTIAMHQAIKDVSERIEDMKFNTAVSALMIYSNHMGTLETIPTEMFETFIKLLSPFAPHIANQMWEEICKSSTLDFEPWPVFDKRALVASNVNIVISINGKKRAEAEIPVDLPNDEVEKFVLSLDGIKKYFDGREPKKIIVVPNKLVNIVV
ncbi:MAG: class I tRNA ligase family protein, partial [Alphaproteobacteria bacterium]|nr:class I tRNA ligase family protein [Alphaproteobacteria bacterium]